MYEVYQLALKNSFYPLICFHEKSTHDVACCLLKRWIVIKNVTEYQITSHSKCVCVPLSKHNLRCYMFPLDVSIGFSTVSNENHATLRWYHRGIKANFLKIIPFPIQSRSISVHRVCLTISNIISQGIYVKRYES